MKKLFIIGYILISSFALAQSPSPLKLVGAFALPPGNFGGNQTFDDFAYGGHCMAYNPYKNSLFIAGHDWDQLLAEVSIPAPGMDINNLPLAQVLQNFKDVTDGLINTLDGTSKLGGLSVIGPDKLLGAAYEYYDADANNDKTLFTSSLNLSTASDAKGLFKVGQLLSGMVCRYMCDIPIEWQQRMGGDIALGGAALAIISRSSQGPALFSINKNTVENSPGGIPYKPLVYYDLPHPNSQYSPTSKNPFYNLADKITGVVWFDNTTEFDNTIVFFGTHGTGDYCYGTGGASGGDCYDPDNNSKGTHAYPYVPYYWSYSAYDLEQVANGLKSPWELQPMSMGDLTGTIPAALSYNIGSVAYDRSKRLLYLSMQYALWPDAKPVIAVYEVKARLNTSTGNSIKTNRNLKLYPNPASDKLFIETGNDEYFERVSIVNSLGNTVLDATNSSTSIDLKDFPTGIYYVNIWNNGTCSRAKLIKTEK